jgi:Sortase domain
MRVAVGAVVTLVLASCGQPQSAKPVTATLPQVRVPATAPEALPYFPTPAPAPPPLVDPALPLSAPAVPIPLRFVAPSVGIDAPILAVGRTPSGAMDAPEGPASSPLWHDTFWYRGGSEPGEQGTTTIAGHVDDVLGRPGAFWNVRDLKVGDVVEIDDSRNGAHSRYRITDAAVYSFAQANSPDLLMRLYGEAAYNGDPNQRNLASDAVSRISIITCTGTFHRGSSFGYDHRYIAFGVLIPDSAPAAKIPASDLRLF